MMKCDRSGISGIEVAPLALGGNVFGWTADEETSFDVLDAFVDAGGNMIDTADVYSAWVPGNSGGESETVIGNWLRRDPSKREQVVIATKVGFFEGLAPDKIAAACDASLRRLGVDVIDLYYHHKDDPDVPLADSLGAMDALVKAGKIRAIGFSQYGAERLDEAMKVAESNGLTRPCALQTWYNLVERPKLEGQLRDAALAHGLGIVPFYGLANGFLTGKYRTKDDLDKSTRGLRNVEYLEGRGPRVLEAMDGSQRRPEPRWRPSPSPGPMPSRASRRRWQARRAFASSRNRLRRCSCASLPIRSDCSTRPAASSS